jgi:hypothetical protein
MPEEPDVSPQEEEILDRNIRKRVEAKKHLRTSLAGKKNPEDEGLEMRQVAVMVERAMHDDTVNDPTLEFYQQKYGNHTR